MSEDRARIPFALVGVLLLVSSATIAATSQPQTPPSEPAVAEALDRATAETQTAVRTAAMEASRDAARNPVVEPADTEAGRVLDESSAFRDSLRIRIYLAVREHLATIDRRRDGVRVTASLPPVNDTADAARAKDRVHVEREDENGTTMRVRVENVTLTASKDGRVLTERRVSPDLVVGSPVLKLHDSVDEYQRKLDAGVASPGLDRRLTAQLYAITWARGYAQYGGAPIENVLHNQHVAVATNAGLLDLQRETFGEADADGRRTLSRAAAKTAGRDLVAGSGADPPGAEQLLGSSTDPPPDRIQGLDPPRETRPEDEMTVGVNGTADDAFLDLVEDDGLNRTISSVYSVDARFVTDVERRGTGRPPAPSAPGPGWSRVSGDRSTTSEASRGGVAPPETPPGWQRYASYSREVEVTTTRTVTWEKDNETRTTSTRATMTRRVAVALVGRPARNDVMPPGEIRTAYDHGAGPLDGPNLADGPDRAVEELVTSAGGPEVILDRAGSNSLDTSVQTVETERPHGVYEWTYRDLMAIREELREVAVTEERGAVATFEANPQAQLAAEVRDQRDDLVDAPASYDSTATKARYTARAAYLDAVLERLDERAANRDAQEDGFADALEERGADSMDEVQAGARASREEPPARQSTLEGPAGPVDLRVDSAPSYMTRGEVRPRQVPAMDGPGHPLVARNVNVFTLPYGDAVDVVFDGLFGSSSGHVRLSTAAQTLRATNATLERRDDAKLRSQRDALLTEVILAERFVRAEMVAELERHGVGDSSGERWDVVNAGMGRWGTWDARALALTNGSASETVTAAADDHESLETTERDRLELALENRNQAALREDEAKPELETVNASRKATKAVATDLAKAAAKNATEEGVARATNDSFDRVPAGAPLAPPVTAWYVTTNVWHVTVRGEYARFGVRADRGRPNAPGADVHYVRDGRPVTLDLDDDGERERLGRSTKVSFDVSTTVVIVVPPGKSGVGDRNGDLDERSEGWPDPGAG